MKLSVCGLDCAPCEFLGKACKGCREMAGKIFWAEGSGRPGCPIYLCAVQNKKLAHCGECAEMPCGLWKNTREPGYTDEEFNAQLLARAQNLLGQKAT